MSKSKNPADIALSVKNLSKTFRLPHEKHSGIKSMFISKLGGKHKGGYEQQKVLDNVSFDIKKGEFFGIVGRNGSGKSTLLKLMAGIYVPDSGKVVVNGSLTPFIELGVGFNPELTGRENVYLNGALLGFSKSEMQAKYDTIVEFAELEDFMDQKLKNYSSGMQVRLAFSIAIQSESDILVLDEVLAVGDEAFQRKCNDFFEKIKKDKTKTIILVTHSMGNIKRYCDRALLLRDGDIDMISEPDEVADAYSKLNLMAKIKEEDSDLDKTVHKDNDEPWIEAKITSDIVLHPSDTLKVEITYKGVININVTAKAYIDLHGRPIMATNPRVLGIEGTVTSDTKEHRVAYELDLHQFNKGDYKLIVLLEDISSIENIATYGVKGELRFKIVNPKLSAGGVLKNTAKMELIE